MAPASTPRRHAILSCARIFADRGAVPLGLEDAAAQGHDPDDPLGLAWRAQADAAACHLRFADGLLPDPADGRQALASQPSPPLRSSRDPAEPPSRDDEAAARAMAYFHALARARAEALGAAWLPGIAANLHQLPEPPAHDPAALLQAQVSSYFRDSLMRGNHEPPLPAVAPALREALPQLLRHLRDAEHFGQLARGVSRQLAEHESTRRRPGGGLMRWLNPRSRPLPSRHLVAAAGQAARTRAPDEPQSLENPFEMPDDAARPDTGRTAHASRPDTDQPPDPTQPDSPLDPGPPLPLELAEGYRVFTRAHDQVIAASQLGHPDELERLRHRLDRAVAPYRRIMQRLAHRLQRRLQASSQERWRHDQDEGELDPARLARLVTRPLERNIFRQRHPTPGGATAVTLLIDNSGSMRGHPMAVAAVTVDILAQTLERCRIPTEILGYTTVDRRHSAAYQDWVAAGSPPRPGRLNGLRHIVYKSMDTPWRRCRRDLGLMLKDEILRENIDGEALWWASQRLRLRPEPRRLLIVISDGAPRDTDTLAHNPGHYLDRHLHQVIRWLLQRTDIALHAIGIGHPVDRYYPNAVTLRSVEGLGEVLTRSVGDWIVGHAEGEHGRRKSATRGGRAA
ncbi:MAG: hypothetical protein M0R28_05045 [Pigmentiphaga sp.]|nr:hypothetical protein [Pigmentiphaga sp.]